MQKKIPFLRDHLPKVEGVCERERSLKLKMSRLDDDEKDHDQESSESKISSKSYEDMIQSKPTFHNTLTLYQSTYTGLDMTMRFDCLRCKGVENSTWLGGFDWEC